MANNNRNNKNKRTATRKNNKTVQSDNLKFEKDYIRFMASSKGVGNVATKKALSIRFLMLIVSIVTLVLIFYFAFNGPYPPVFILPFSLIVLFLITIPSLVLVIKSIYYRGKFVKLFQMVKKIKNEPKKKAYFIRSKGKYYTFLVYDTNVKEEICLKEVEQLNKLLSEDKSLKNFSKLYAATSQLNLKGELKITDFSKKFTVYKKVKDYPLIQVQFKVSDLKEAVVSGYSFDNNFLLYPPPLWFKTKPKAKTRETR